MIRLNVILTRGLDSYESEEEYSSLDVAKKQSFLQMLSLRNNYDLKGEYEIYMEFTNDGEYIDSDDGFINFGGTILTTNTKKNYLWEIYDGME